MSDDDSRIQETISTDSGDAAFHAAHQNINNTASDASHFFLSKRSSDSQDDHDDAIPHFPSNLRDTLNNLQDLNNALPTSPREIASSHSFDLSYEEEDDDDDNDGAASFIASIRDLKDHASKRRGRNSLLMQERFRMSSSYQASSSLMGDDDDDDAEGGGGEMMEIGMSKRRSEEENEVPNSGENYIIDVTKSPPTHAPEHMVIAIRLLRAHKEHVDTVMETLKIEMDTLRDFDNLLEETGRPTEEEVLDYFEALGLCLDQRTQSGTLLQREMDRISRGEPPRK
jgi:hypothetical protein